MLRVPFGGRRTRVRLDRVEVPAPVGPSLLPQKREREAEPRVVPVAESGQHVEADEKVVVIVDRPMETIPRLVPRSLAMQLMIEIVLGPSLDAALHSGGPFPTGICGARAHALPRVQGPPPPRGVPTTT